MAILITSVLLLWPTAAAAQSPTPAILGTADTRTTDGPTVVGGPVEVLVGVVLLGAATALMTFIVVWARSRWVRHG